MPNNPDNNPIIKVSALNMDDMLCLEAPIALSIPISFTLSTSCGKNLTYEISGPHKIYFSIL